jgi:transmembrane sensor
MIVSYFKNLFHKKRNTEADEARIKKMVADFKQDPKSWNEDTMGLQSEVRTQVLNRLLDSISIIQHSSKNNNKRNWAIAASITIMLGAGLIGFQYRGALLDVIDPATLIVVKTSGNEIKKITLGDGSVVWLNGASTLRYPDRFSYNKREITLVEGEAYFDVHHDEGKPFQVMAGKTLTNVLGTSFNISSYNDVKSISVTVSRGKVAVNNEILLPNQQLIYTKSSGKLEHKILQAAEVSSWMQGKLSFQDEDFKTIATKLENKFNVNISFSNKEMEDFHLTASFESSDSLNDVLDALTLTKGLKYTIKNKNISITN